MFILFFVSIIFLDLFLTFLFFYMIWLAAE